MPLCDGRIKVGMFTMAIVADNIHSLYFEKPTSSLLGATYTQIWKF